MGERKEGIERHIVLEEKVRPGPVSEFVTTHLSHHSNSPDLNYSRDPERCLPLRAGWGRTTTTMTSEQFPRASKPGMTVLLSPTKL